MDTNSQQEYSGKAGFGRIAWVLGGIIFFLILAAAANRKNDLTVVATVVKVEPLDGGNFLIDSSDVIRLIRRNLDATIDDQSAGALDVDRIERFLEEDPFVKNAEVVITANSKVKIFIEQREPIMRVMDAMGAQYYVDKDGFRVPLSKHFTARTLVANGNIQPHTPDFMEKKRHGMKDLFQLASLIANDDLWKAMIEQVYVTNRHEFVMIPKVGDQSIVLGKFENVDEKLERLKIFYLEGMSREGWNKYRKIDLRYDGQVVCER
jgi:cell division protein FtsQ